MGVSLVVAGITGIGRSWTAWMISVLSWFKQATVDSILSLERPAPQHLRWPDLDVDLAVDAIEHPERYPLTSRL